MNRVRSGWASMVLIIPTLFNIGVLGFAQSDLWVAITLTSLLTLFYLVFSKKLVTMSKWNFAIISIVFYLPIIIPLLFMIMILDVVRGL